MREWRLSVGSSPGASDLYDSGALDAATTQLTVSGLPIAGEKLFARFSWCCDDGAWVSSDLQYTAATVEQTTSAPNLTIWGLVTMGFGILIVLTIDARRWQAACRARIVERAAGIGATRIAVALASAAGLLLLLAYSPALQQLLDPLNLMLAKAVEHLVNAWGIPVTRSGVVLTHPDGFAYRIDYLCSGFQPWVLITMAILAVRATWRQRVAGILIALVCVEIFNIARLVHLYWLGVHWPQAYDMGHEVVWNVLAVLTGLVYLGVWLAVTGDRAAARGGRRSAPDPCATSVARTVSIEFFRARNFVRANSLRPLAGKK